MTQQGISVHGTKERSRVEQAIRLMTQYAGRTGLLSDRTPTRYLWTDAFAVCNFLGLAQVTGNRGYTELAVRLVEQVHGTLGRHRVDDPHGREGWLSGEDDGEGAQHPTRGGLRIGKPLPERSSGDAYDPQREWDRDGQYFHYLAKWMHALDQVARATEDPRYNLWARELAEVAYRAFTYRQPGLGQRMVWKMSVDLSRPLVRSMGQHDPIDGFVTCLELGATAVDLADDPDDVPGPDLRAEAAGFASMAASSHWATIDPLGIGGLLSDACRLALSTRRSPREGVAAHAEWLPALLAAALEGLAHYGRRGELQQPAPMRLAFRELGLAIGLASVDLIDAELRDSPERFSQADDVHALLHRLESYAGLGAAIESCWREPENRQNATWTAHADINDIMLVTSLVPGGFLVP